MINYWWVSRPKQKLDSIPEVLSVFAEISLNQTWEKQMGKQRSFEDALERAGLKREGARRDARGSGGRTYEAWLRSLGLIFKQESTKQIKLTMAGEAIMAGDSPVSVLRNQVMKYQFPSSFSLGTNVDVSRRFKIRPFKFLLKLLVDKRIKYLTVEEIAKVIIVQAENESAQCYEKVVNDILNFRKKGDDSLEEDYYEKYKSNRNKDTDTREDLFVKFINIAHTLTNWLEYTQLVVKNDETKRLEIIPERLDDILKIVNNRDKFIDRPEDHEYFQRKYGLDPKHTKDTRNLEQTQTVTIHMIQENRIKQSYIYKSLRRPIAAITPDLISEIAIETGIQDKTVESVLRKAFPHGSIGSFMSSYFELAFHGRKDAIEFEKATTELFRDVFGYQSIHLGQTGAKSAPDILLISKESEYQAIIDNKAYGQYSISGDHHNRMVHNYIEKIDTYSSCELPIGFFTYISGGFSSNINRQISKIVNESGVNGSCVTVSNFIKMIENQTSGNKNYTHNDLKRIFGVNREVLLSDI